MRKTVILLIFALAVAVASRAQQTQPGKQSSQTSLSGITPDLRNGFHFSLRGGYDIYPKYPETRIVTGDVRLITAVKGGIMSGISADYYWDWLGLGMDADYIHNRMRIIEHSEFNGLSRFFCGAGPNFRYLDPSCSFSIELNARAGLGYIRTGKELLHRVKYDTDNAFSLKGQLRFTYFVSPWMGFHAGTYYMHHFKALYSEYIYSIVEQEGYSDPKEIDVSSIGAFAGVTFRIPTVPAVPVRREAPASDNFAINGIVVVCGTKQPIEGVSIVVKEMRNGQERLLRSDRAGTFSFTVTPTSELTIYGKKANYFSQVVTLGPSDFKRYRNVRLEICMERADCDESVRLNNIHYDLDKYDIRPDARPELDRLVQFLRDNPDVRVELSSHTDSRASHQYNERLSQNRANAARQYVISRGIDPSRVISVGYGETRLLNRCSDGVPCSEAEHQQNRRTEMKVICPK